MLDDEAELTVINIYSTARGRDVGGGGGGGGGPRFRPSLKQRWKAGELKHNMTLCNIHIFFF